jgi:hypothetical protein
MRQAHRLNQARTAAAVTEEAGSHNDQAECVFAQVIDVVGRTSRHASRPILIEGDPLPVRLRRSRNRCQLQ